MMLTSTRDASFRNVTESSLYEYPISIYNYIMKTKRLFFVVLIMGALPLAAQSESAVFAPFVSRLQGEVKNNLVRLSWADSPDVQGSVYIYRAAQPFERSVLSSAAGPIEIPYGVQSFVDEIETEGVLYYFVAASDESGRKYDILLSSGNTIAIRVSLPGQAAAPNAPVERTPVSIEWNGVSSIEAVPQGEKVIISFFAGSVRNAALYRSVRPITQVQDLLGSVIVQTKISSPFTDFPVPGIPYYYAVISEENLVRGMVTIMPGRNATSLPVEASAAGQPDAAGREIRSIPLPQLSGAYASSSTELSPQAARALEDIPVRPLDDPSLKKPRVFARDIAVHPAGSEEHALASIITGAFAARDWEGSRDELTRFLALPRSAEVRARAKFYLGQSCYFLHKPRDGLFEFLALQERYPAESMEWIQASLEMMKK
jgi:hypothetical protein